VKKQKRKTARIYLDYGATTPLDPVVLKVIDESFKNCFGNPASLHEEGRYAKKVLEDARASIAHVFFASPSEIIFTGGGTESNNLALLGLIESFKKTYPEVTPHVITTTIEHSSVLETLKKIESNGVEVTYLKPTADGLIDPKELREALRPTTLLISIMYANNEIGTILPLGDIAKVVRHFRNEKKSVYNMRAPYLHTDAAQALQYLDVNTAKLGFDLMSLDSGKIYGPKGVGALYIRRGTPVSGQSIGGGQEAGLRSGTENVPLIAGFAKAIQINEKMKAKESVRISGIRDYFIKKLLLIPGTTLNGSAKDRIPNNVSVCIEGLDAEFAVFQLDKRGISVSSASTCMSLKEDSYSYVVEEIGKGNCRASSLRFSLGRGTTKKDIDTCLKALLEILSVQFRRA